MGATEVDTGNRKLHCRSASDPDGYIALAVAENRLSFEILRPKLQESLSLPSEIGTGPALPCIHRNLDSRLISIEIYGCPSDNRSEKKIIRGGDVIYSAVIIDCVSVKPSKSVRTSYFRDIGRGIGAPACEVLRTA